MSSPRETGLVPHQRLIKALYRNNLTEAQKYAALIGPDEPIALVYNWNIHRDHEKDNPEWQEVMSSVFPRLKIQGWGTLFHYGPRCPWMAEAMIKNPGWKETTKVKTEGPLPTHLLLAALSAGKPSRPSPRNPKVSELPAWLDTMVDTLLPHVPSLDAVEWKQLGFIGYTKDAQLAKVIRGFPSPTPAFVQHMVVGANTSLPAWPRAASAHADRYPKCLETIRNYAWTDEIREAFIVTCLERSQFTLLPKYGVDPATVRPQVEKVLVDEHLDLRRKVALFTLPLWSPDDARKRMDKVVQNYPVDSPKKTIQPADDVAVEKMKRFLEADQLAQVSVDTMQVDVELA